MPIRTCLACGRKLPQRELVRVVGTNDRTVEIDFRGRMAGRGAYLCIDEQCWEAVLKKDDLDRALSVSLSHKDKRDLMTKWLDWQQTVAGEETS